MQIELALICQHDTHLCSTICNLFPFFQDLCCGNVCTLTDAAVASATSSYVTGIVFATLHTVSYIKVRLRIFMHYDIKCKGYPIRVKLFLTIRFGWYYHLAEIKCDMLLKWIILTLNRAFRESDKCASYRVVFSFLVIGEEELLQAAYID